MEMWKTLRVSHISTPPTATTNYFLKRRYTNIPLGTKDRSDHNDATLNLAVVAGTDASPLQFVPVTPCRLLDTRPQYGGSGPIQGGTFQTFNLPQLAQSGG